MEYGKSTMSKVNAFCSWHNELIGRKKCRARILCLFDTKRETMTKDLNGECRLCRTFVNDTLSFADKCLHPPLSHII